MKYISRPSGATEDSLRGLEVQYLMELPPDLREFWLQSDGPILWYGYKELQFFSVADAIEDIYLTQKYMPGALPLCLDGNGNICVAQLVDGTVHGYYAAACGNLDWQDAVRIGNNFTDLLTDIESPEHRLRNSRIQD